MGVDIDTDIQTYRSLGRINIPTEIVDAIKSPYRMPLFQVYHRKQPSEKLLQRTGIRRGCPLNLYLLILTMSVIFTDVKDKFNDPCQRSTFQRINCQEHLYADDTRIIAKSSNTANSY